MVPHASVVPTLAAASPMNLPEMHVLRLLLSVTDSETLEVIYSPAIY